MSYNGHIRRESASDAGWLDQCGAWGGSRGGALWGAVRGHGAHDFIFWSGPVTGPGTVRPCVDDLRSYVSMTHTLSLSWKCLADALLSNDPVTITLGLAGGLSCQC